MTIITSFSPFDNSVLGEVESHCLSEIEHIVTNSRKIQEIWQNFSVQKRTEILQSVLVGFQKHTQELAQSISAEMGMPISQAIEEVKYGFMYWEGYLKLAIDFSFEEITKEDNTQIHTVLYEAKGIVLAISPWNYPFSMFVWACIQALIVGNTVIFKTSKETILTGKLIQKIWNQYCEIPEIWQEVFGDGSTGDILLQQNIDFITFTGSTQVGKHIYQSAASKMIGCVMELGGSAPGIVLDDANIDDIIESIYFFRYSNCGQMCDGLKRLIVARNKYDEVVEKLSKILISKKIGNPLVQETDIGPLVNLHQKQTFEAQVQDALKNGAQILASCHLSENLKGNFSNAVLLGNIHPDMRVWKEEVFGPALPIVAFDSFEQMVELANDTQYGLGAYVFTQDREKFQKIAKLLKTGEVQHNTLNYCIPENPFGGYKMSGLGREHGHWGFTEFCNIKVISFQK